MMNFFSLKKIKKEKGMNFFLLLFFTMCVAMTMHQARIARKIMLKRKVPQWSRIVDAALSDEVAFTNQDTLTAYIDASRFAAAPNSWWNVVLHECGHLAGAQHGDGTLAMNYRVTTLENGTIVNDRARIFIPDTF